MGMAGSKRPGRGRRAAASVKLKMTIASDSAASRDVADQILDEIQRRGYNSQTLFDVKLALTEAFINAIKHGNQKDPNKKIHIEAAIDPKKVVISLEDEGSGFDRAGVPDPTLEENLEKCTGRGIHLIESYMNEVKWTRGGRRLKMVKYNRADLLPRA
jgi:serine/threonine-protein kinase RsbW